MNDTIVAIATPESESALSILRISGEKSLDLCRDACKLPSPTPRHAYLTKYSSLEGEILDQIILVYYENGKSFTSEHTVELSCHGNPFLVKEIVNDLIDRGCRIANPGEFSYRAFKNNKIDLTQAEAIAQLIGAKNKQALSLANKNLSGNLSEKIIELQNKILKQQSIIEAFIDFPEDDLGNDQKIQVIQNLKAVRIEVNDLIVHAKRTDVFNRCLNVAIIGPPNAGKSSIFNYIIGSERAIVDENAGTTRDFIEKKIQLGCINVNLIDTAGIRNTDENIEKKGINKTIELQKEADLVLLVFDCSLPFPEDLHASLEDLIFNKNVIIVLNKSDLGKKIEISSIKLKESIKIETSIKEAKSLALLQGAIEENLLGESKAYNELGMSVNLRQSHALKNASHSLKECISNLSKEESIELSIPEIKDSIKYLGEIVGDIDNEDMLDILFSNFCIGK